MSALDTLAATLLRAADQLEHGSVYERAWAAHFREDRKAALLMAVTWREPSELLTNATGRTDGNQ